MMCRAKSTSGFTLTELIVVVAIIAILAAVAIPVVTGYIHRSRASEVYTVLQGIREKEEAYFSEFKRYTTDLPMMPSTFALDNTTCSETKLWDFNQAAANGWKQLGFTPGGPTYYWYWVETNFDAAGVMGSGTLACDRPCFTAYAMGNADCDKAVIHFRITHDNKTVIPYCDGDPDCVDDGPNNTY